MAHNLSDVIEHEGPTQFDRAELESVDDLFEERAALFYTPTRSIPERYVGAGRLEVRLPIALPARFELRELIGYAYPRVWVDLLQRATGKIRWQPSSRALIRVEVHDVRDESYWARGGAKALVDALKAQTTGRPDGRVLFYFGAIEDDAPQHIELTFVQRPVRSAAAAFTAVVVEPG